MYKGIILDLHGPNFFLDNFYPAEVYYEENKYPTSEHAFAAMKTLDPQEQYDILLADTPAEAKALGRKCTLREDWEAVKYSIMKDVVKHKFLQHSVLLKKLHKTHGYYIAEGNTWNDRCWGVVFNTNTNAWEGKNWLGKILMELREELYE